MTDINLDNLPLAKGGQALNRVIGTQVNDNGVSSLALFPLKTLSAAPGGRIARLTMATTPAEPGDAQPARLTVYTDDGNSYPVDFTIPPGARGFSVADVECEQDAVTPGEASLVRLTVTLDNGQKLAPIALSLPPGKDSLTITDTSVTQGPVEAGKPSKVTVTTTHSDGTQASYAYDAPPGAPGFVETDVIKTHTTDVDAPVDLVSINKGGKDLAVRRQDTGEWKYFYPEDQSVHALTYSDADARPTTIRTQKSGWREKPTLIVQNDGFDDFNAPSIIAVDDAINAETARAQAAESTLISGQGYGGDNLNISRLWIGSGDTVWLRDQNNNVQNLALQTTLTAEISRAQAAESTLISGQGYGGDNLNISRLWIGSGNTVWLRDQNNNVQNLALQTTLTAEISRAQAAESTLISGQGYVSGDANITRMWVGSGGTILLRDQNDNVNYLPVTNNSDGKTLIQAFTTTGTDANPFISFPVSFKKTCSVAALVTREDNSSNFNNSRFVNINLNDKTDGTSGQINPNGFWAQIVTVTDIASDSKRPWQLSVVAVGIV